MQEQKCALLTMIEEAETPLEKIIRYDSGNDQNLERLSGVFYFNDEQFSRNHHLPRQMTRKNESGQYVFDVDPAYAYLYDMTMYQVLPAVSVKEEFRQEVRIAWCPYPGLNIVQQAFMREGDRKTLLNADRNWYNIHYQYYESAKLEHYNRYCGHIPALTEWTCFLPEFKLRIPQPWFFTRDNPFPIFQCPEKISFSYTMKKHILNLLRVEVFNRETGEWAPPARVKPSWLQYLDKGTLPEPIMIAEYSVITNIEMEETKKQPARYVVEDIRYFGSPRIDKANPVATVLIDIADPIKAIFYMAENTNATKVNNFSNFSTSAEDINEGGKPIREIEVTYNDTPFIPLASEFSPVVLADYWEYYAAGRLFPGFPVDPGYAVIPIGYDMKKPIHDSFKSGRIVLNFRLAEESQEENHQSVEVEENFISTTSLPEKPLKNDYIIHVYVLYLKRLSFSDKEAIKIN